MYYLIEKHIWSDFVLVVSISHLSIWQTLATAVNIHEKGNRKKTEKKMKTRSASETWLRNLFRHRPLFSRPINPVCLQCQISSLIHANRIYLHIFRWISFLKVCLSVPNILIPAVLVDKTWWSPEIHYRSWYDVWFWGRISPRFVGWSQRR